MIRLVMLLLATLLLGAAADVQRFRVAGTAIEITTRTVPGIEGVRLSDTEIPWELLDAFVHEKVDAAGASVDAVARPSKPYISMDRGFGHAGFPAISVNSDTAQAFCAWLSRRMGRTVRLPRVSELRAACAASGASPDIWHAGRSGGKTRRVGSGKPDATGFHDLQGNVAEWAIDDQGEVVLWGGSFQDPAEGQGCDRIRRPDPDWNASDPQMPPSRWWLADGPFIGFRVAVEDASRQNAPMPERSPPSGKEKTDGPQPPATP
jgi:hypothetical protein